MVNVTTKAPTTSYPPESQSRFGLAEFPISALIFLMPAFSVFVRLSKIQSKSNYQNEIQAVLNNTRHAIQIVGRYLRQAENDPMGIGLSGRTVVSPSEVRITSDLTGSSSPENPVKGDPDEDANDSRENVTSRYNDATRSLEIIPQGGLAQIVAGYIPGLSFRFCYCAGGPIVTVQDVGKINITVEDLSLSADPENHRILGLQPGSDFHAETRCEGLRMLF